MIARHGDILCILFLWFTVMSVAAVLQEQCFSKYNHLQCKNRPLEHPFAIQEEKCLTLHISSCDFQELNDDMQWFKQLKSLSIINSTLQSVSENAFANLTKLMHVDIVSTKISELRPEIFARNNMLSTLTLSKNKIETISNNFTLLPNLNKLDLQGNDMTSITSGTFISLIHVESIDLSFNNISELEPGAFNFSVAAEKSSSVLRLDRNRIPNLAAGSFRGCSALAELHLSHNRLALLAPGAFAGLRALRHLDLRANRLRHLGASLLAPLVSLQELRLDDNALERVDSGAFAHCEALRAVSLSRNELTQLSDGAFAGLAQLRSLHLDHNAISELHAETFCPLQSTQRIWLHGNSIVEASANTFCNNMHLEEVHLDSGVNLNLNVTSATFIRAVRLHLSCMDYIDVVSQIEINLHDGVVYRNELSRNVNCCVSKNIENFNYCGDQTVNWEHTTTNNFVSEYNKATTNEITQTETMTISRVAVNSPTVSESPQTTYEDVLRKTVANTTAEIITRIITVASTSSLSEIYGSEFVDSNRQETSSQTVEMNNHSDTETPNLQIQQSSLKESDVITSSTPMNGVRVPQDRNSTCTCEDNTSILVGVLSVLVIVLIILLIGVIYFTRECWNRRKKERNGSTGIRRDSLSTPGNVSIRTNNLEHSDVPTVTPCNADTTESHELLGYRIKVETNDNDQG